MVRGAPSPRTFLLMVAIVSAWSWGTATAAFRDQTSAEIAYSDLGPAARSPIPCERIHPRAGSPDSLRDRCYFDLALATGDATWCAKVVSRKKPSVGRVLPGLKRECLEQAKSEDERRECAALDVAPESSYTAAACRQRVAAKEAWEGSYGFFSVPNAERIAGWLGYTRKDLTSEALLAGSDNRIWSLFLERAMERPDFAKRLRKLPDYSRVAKPEEDLCTLPSIRSKMGCCLDLDRNAVCDEREWTGAAVRRSDLAIALTPVGPAVVQCGNEPFSVVVVVRNLGSHPVRAGEGYLHLEAPAVRLGLEPTDLYRPLPGIPAQGEARVAWTGLLDRVPQAQARALALSVRLALHDPRARDRGSPPFKFKLLRENACDEP